MLTDNGSEFRSQTFRDTIRGLGAVHSFIHAGRPQSNGVVERVQETILDECWKPAFAWALVPKLHGLGRDLEAHLAYCDRDRAHTGRWTQGRTPEQVIGAAKLWSNWQRCVARSWGQDAR